MSDLAEEVIDTIEKTDPKTSLWRKMVFIMAANALGTLIGGGLLGFCAIVWTKSNAIDNLRQEMNSHREKSLKLDDAILREIALIKAQFKIRVESELPDSMPPGTPETEEGSAPLPEPTFKQVEAEEEKIQKKVDKAIYRQGQNK